MNRFINKFREAKKYKYLLVWCRYAQDYDALPAESFMLKSEVIIKDFRI